MYQVVTGGTVGSGINHQGVRDVDPQAQSFTRQLLERIPSTNYKPLSVAMRGDSSAHPRSHLLELSDVVVKHANQADGVIIEHGTDTMNLSAATLALAGNETLIVPVTFLGSIRGPEQKGSDAPENTITAGFFTAFGDASGVFAVRPGGHIITSRHDTPAGSLDWHVRGSLEVMRAWQELRESYFDPNGVIQRKLGSITFDRTRGLHKISNYLRDATRIGYFARVNVGMLVDTDFCWKFFPRIPKRSSLLSYFEENIKYQRTHDDSTLDYADDIPIGGRGRVPSIRILGLSRDRIKAFKDRPNDDSPEDIHRDMEKVVDTLREKGRVVGKVILPLTLVEHVRRHRAKGAPLTDADPFHHKWKGVFQKYLVTDLKLPWNVAQNLQQFWEKYSNQPNGAMDFSGLSYVHVSNDPNLLYRAFQHAPPQGLVLQTTGAAGLRLRDDFGESYAPLLTNCRQSGIPVVLTSSSRGEVTSFEYGPGREALESDLCFFAGTMDNDLVQPRMALLNHPEQRRFLNDLVAIVDAPKGIQEAITRNIYRQLLSGSHYRAVGEGETSDRARVEGLYGIETRVDLLSGMHVKKAVLASYLHEVSQRGLQVPKGIVEVLK